MSVKLEHKPTFDITTTWVIFPIFFLSHTCTYGKSNFSCLAQCPVGEPTTICNRFTGAGLDLDKASLRRNGEYTQEEEKYTKSLYSFRHNNNNLSFKSSNESSKHNRFETWRDLLCLLIPAWCCFGGRGVKVGLTVGLQSSVFRIYIYIRSQVVPKVEDY